MDQASDSPTPRLGVHSLPDTIRRLFADMFVPCVIAKLGCSSTPWQCVTVLVLQAQFALIYSNHDLTIVKGDALESPVCSANPDPLPACIHTS